MTKPLWAPWRLEYVGQADEQDGCIFCSAAEAEDEPGLVVRRGTKAFALLNKYPYASGHLMVAPYRHVGEFRELDDEEALEIHRLSSQGMGALAQLYGPQGFNLGWNLGRIAGAGVTDHVHLHSCRGGRATPTSCPCWPTSKFCLSTSPRLDASSPRPGLAETQAAPRACRW